MYSTNRKSAQAKAKSAERKAKQQACGSNVFKNKSSHHSGGPISNSGQAKRRQN